MSMEATGVYWKPVVNLLEAYTFQVVLVVNPQHIKRMPSTKTDVQRIPPAGHLISWAGFSPGQDESAGKTGATGRHILLAAYAILKTPGTVYQDLGANYFDERNKQPVVRREIRRLEALGYRVTVESASQAS